jgi:hypothetical protein
MEGVMTAVTALGVILGTLVFAFAVASGYERRLRLDVLIGCAAAMGGCVTWLVVAAGMLVLGEPS